MEMKHILLECYCECKNRNEELPCYKYNNKMGVYCLEHTCKYLSYTESPNEIAYANEHGVVEDELDFVGFGGDMNGNDDNKTKELIEKWNKICRKKIDEAYEEYMDYRNS
ncbi:MULTISPECIES: hypothetical protein [unclassified Clostridium]|uniref:hypothetical protein n=1 Tax=unclassified Clostridium TaxID=2614128 RepID=UPI0013FA562B|nr:MULTISPECIES: hypothetical protein [unclassified Clostridium]MBN1054011.1 hypothetical protein [Clostridium botulinum]NFR87710.1 hypothetical protein [Clostridium botulinum]NFR90473.1 hypothetical protein [Clostridium botulinum]NFT98357.1 hypothetical protein [Clostridium botulinum]